MTESPDIDPSQIQSYDQFRKFLSDECSLFAQIIRFEDPWENGEVDQETLDRLSVIASGLKINLPIAEAQLQETFEGWEPAIESAIRNTDIYLDDEDPSKWSLMGEIEGSPVTWSVIFRGSEFVEVSAGG